MVDEATQCVNCVCHRLGSLHRLERLDMVWCLPAAYFAGIEFSGVDGTFLKHIHLKQKACLLLLVTRDGDNRLLVIAWCYCLSETSQNYDYMAMQLKAMGHAVEYMSRPTHLLYSDRMKGIKHFEKHFACGHANCIVHIIKNVFQHVAGIPAANGKFHPDMIHAIQQASTEEEFRELLNKFRRGFPEAAAYLDSLPHDKVFSYALVKSGYATHGHRTSNIVEVMNNVVKDARNLDCYRLCDWIVTWWGQKVAERQRVCKTMTRSKSLYTPYAQVQINKQEVFAREGDMRIMDQGDETYMVIETFKDENVDNRRHGRDGPVTRVERNTVDMKNKTCTCVHVREHRLPCKHVILCTDNLSLRTTLQGQYQFRKDWVAPYFWRENYTRAYEGIRVQAPVINNNTYIDVPSGKKTRLDKLRRVWTLVDESRSTLAARVVSRVVDEPRL